VGLLTETSPTCDRSMLMSPDFLGATIIVGPRWNLPLDTPDKMQVVNERIYDEYIFLFFF
jgi:hypothetical protein